MRNLFKLANELELKYQEEGTEKLVSDHWDEVAEQLDLGPTFKFKDGEFESAGQRWLFLTSDEAFQFAEDKIVDAGIPQDQVQDILAQSMEEHEGLGGLLSDYNNEELEIHLGPENKPILAYRMRK